jgi:seryl-tRNA synthetase
MKRKYTEEKKVENNGSGGLPSNRSNSLSPTPTAQEIKEQEELLYEIQRKNIEARRSEPSNGQAGGVGGSGEGGISGLRGNKTIDTLIREGADLNEIMNQVQEEDLNASNTGNNNANHPQNIGRDSAPSGDDSGLERRNNQAPDYLRRVNKIMRPLNPQNQGIESTDKIFKRFYQALEGVQPDPQPENTQTDNQPSGIITNSAQEADRAMRVARQAMQEAHQAAQSATQAAENARQVAQHLQENIRRHQQTLEEAMQAAREAQLATREAQRIQYEIQNYLGSTTPANIDRDVQRSPSPISPSPKSPSPNQIVNFISKNTNTSDKEPKGGGGMGL